MSIDIALCSDRRVLPGLAVTVRSALENSTQTLNVNVICSQLSGADKDHLKKSWAHPKCGQVTFADIAPQSIRNFRSTSYLKSKTAYARYFIAEQFPDVSRCIYLDTDLLVLRDLAETLEIDLGDNLAAAVRDVSTRHWLASPSTTNRLGLRDEKNYFNSGFMIMDLDAWRLDNLPKKLADISIERFDELHAQDQDALNILLEDRVLLLPDYPSSYTACHNLLVAFADS